MAEKILATERIVITRRESGFDRACDAAYSMAVALFKIDDCGHSSIKGWDRSRCSINVTFEKYEHSGGMGGQEHTYIFRGEAVRCEEFEDENDE